MKVNRQKEIKLINKAGAMFHYDDLRNAMLWRAEKPIAQRKTVFMHGRYPAISIHGTKYHIHRLLACYYAGKILPRNLSVHHIDGNRKNAARYNLTIFKNGMHLSKHNKGRRLSNIHKKRISKANRKRKGIKMKKRVVLPLNEISQMLKQNMSINSIAKRFGCDWSTIKSRINANPELLEARKK